MSSGVVIENLEIVEFEEGNLVVFRCKEAPTEEEREVIGKIIRVLTKKGGRTGVLCVGPDWSVEVYQKSKLEEGGKDAMRKMPGTDG